MTTTATPTTWANRVQATTLATATAYKQRWETDDLELVVEFTETVSDEDLALVLGRSLYAIWNIQYRLRHEGVEGVLQASKVDATQVRPLSNRVYTFVGDDVPPGWND